MKTEDFLNYEVLGKMEAAKRQLDTAIDLWFSEADEVSTHTLVGAAFEVINALTKKRGVGDLLLTIDSIPSDQRAAFREAMRKDFMFFKHADRDPDGETTFFPFLTMFFLMVMLDALRTMGEKLSDNQLAFFNWAAINLPDLLQEDTRRDIEKVVPPEQRAFMRSLGKREFFEVSRQGTAQARANGRI